MIDIYFWGVRGSCPSGGKEFIKYGGNTSCISVVTDNNHYIFDCGTGIQNLGKTFTSLKKAALFISHTHYDHVIGLPFFNKIWQTDFIMDVYAGTVKPYGGTQS